MCQGSISSFGSVPTAPWHHQHGPTRAAVLGKPPAKTVSYFHGIQQEKPTGFRFPVQKLEFQSFQLSQCKQTHRLPPTSAHPGSEQPSLHTPGEAVRAAQALILLTNKPFFPTSVSAEATFSPTNSVLLVNIITLQKSYLRYGRTNIVSGLRGSQI